MTTDNICFYLQNRLIQTSQRGGQWYSDTSPLVFPAYIIRCRCGQSKGFVGLRSRLRQRRRRTLRRRKLRPERDDRRQSAGRDEVRSLLML